MGEWRLWAVWIATLCLCVVLVVSAFHPWPWNSAEVTKQLAHAGARMETALSKL
jgi:hypothetical protein